MSNGFHKKRRRSSNLKKWTRKSHRRQTRVCLSQRQLKNLNNYKGKSSILTASFSVSRPSTMNSCSPQPLEV